MALSSLEWPRVATPRQQASLTALTPFASAWGWTAVSQGPDPCGLLQAHVRLTQRLGWQLTGQPSCQTAGSCGRGAAQSV